MTPQRQKTVIDSAGKPEPDRRLFFALWPDATTREQLSTLGISLAHPGARITTPQNLHLTLTFLGNVPEELTRLLLEQAGRLSCPPFALRLEKQGRWKRSGILWLGPAQTPPALAHLVHTLTALAADIGLPPPEHAFRPHITLARGVRQPVKAVDLQPLNWPVREFFLVESRPGSGAQEYHRIGRWPLSSS